MHKSIWETACIDERRLKKHGQHPLWNHKIFWGSFFKRVFENRSLIKNKSFGVLPFDRKRQRLLKLFAKSFTKNLYNSSVLSSLTFQTVSKKNCSIILIFRKTRIQEPGLFFGQSTRSKALPFQK